MLRQRPELKFPAEMYLEGSDQHRGWFQSSLFGQRRRLWYGALQNRINPRFYRRCRWPQNVQIFGQRHCATEVINELGGDILRWWVADTDYSGEMTVSKEILRRNADAYRRVRNTCRFLLANLNGFNPQSDVVSGDKLLPLDAWMVSYTKNCKKNHRALYGLRL